MVDLQGRGAGFGGRDGPQRSDPIGGRSGRVDEVESGGRLPVAGGDFEHYVVLVQLGVDHRHFRLAKGVVESRIQRTGSQAQTGRGDPVIGHDFFQSSILLIAIHVR